VQAVRFVFHPLFASSSKVRFDIWATDEPQDQFVLAGHCSEGMRKVGEVLLELEQPAAGAAAAAAGQQGAGQGAAAGQPVASPRPIGYSYSLGWGGGWPCGQYQYGMWAARGPFRAPGCGVPTGQQAAGSSGSSGSAGGAGSSGNQERRLLVEVRFGCGVMKVGLCAGPAGAVCVLGLLGLQLPPAVAVSSGWCMPASRAEAASACRLRAHLLAAAVPQVTAVDESTGRQQKAKVGRALPECSGAARQRQLHAMA
jgi:hypothetical protein